MYKANGFGMERMPGANGKTVIDKLSVFVEYSAFYDLITAIGVVIEQGVANVLHIVRA